MLKKVFTRPDNSGIFAKQLLTEADKLVISSLPIVGVISVFIGAVLVIQTASNLENPLIPKMYAGYMVRESLILEFCSTMIALILAGTVGSNIASELGTMRITEQIDAMEVMGINSANYLILPKLIASMVLNIVLLLFSFIMGIFGAWLIVKLTGIITMNDLTTGLQFCYNPYYITYAIVKMVVYSFIIVTVSAFFGYNVKGTSLDVGKANTRAIVISNLAILISDLMITQTMLN